MSLKPQQHRLTFPLNSTQVENIDTMFDTLFKALRNGSVKVNSEQLAAAGTTTTVLHGNENGSPAYSKVVLTTDVSGFLPIASGGTNAVAQVTNGVVYFDGTKITSGSLLATDGSKFTKYQNVTTVGWGVPAIYGTGRQTAKTAAIASLATYTVGAADGTFHVSANVNVTTSTTHNFTVTVAYTDETNTAQTLTLTFSSLAGVLLTAITNVTGAGPYSGIPVVIRCKAATAITIATTGTFTTVTYNAEGSITQTA